MPIPLDQIQRDAIIARVLAPSLTVGELLYLFAEQPAADRPRALAIVRVSAGAYAVVGLDDLCSDAWPQDASLLPRRLSDLPGLLRADAPLRQEADDLDAARARLGEANRSRLVVLDRDGAPLGCLVDPARTWARGADLLALIGARSPLESAPAVLGPGAGDVPAEAPPSAPANINTRIDGPGPNQPMTVGISATLHVMVGPPTTTSTTESTRPFDFDFSDLPTVKFNVRVDADPDAWAVIAAQTTMIVQAPGKTTQEALFIVTPKQACSDKLLISVERADTGALVQKFWLPVVAVAAGAASKAAAPAAAIAAPRTEVALPLDGAGIARRAVEITIQPGEQDFVAVVRADLPSGTVRDTYRVPVNGVEIQNAALRLRQELEKIVFYRADDGSIPFASKTTLDVDLAVAKKATLALADAGEQVWRLLFNAPRAPDGLKQFAADLRGLPDGSTVQVVLESEQFIIPWALLYDKPGLINADTLDWSGFWGYRYILDALPPGRYPAPTISTAPVSIQLLFNDDANLREFTGAQEQFARSQLGTAQVEVVWGNDAILKALAAQTQADLVYFYCHGDHESGAATGPSRDVTALASESALQFGGQQRTRVADLRRLPAAPLARRPLVFLNACEGATQDAFYYDGFMPFFIEEQGARGFIGTEVKAPQLLAHDFALEFLRLFAQGRSVGEILWQLRRQYLDTHHTILGFNYSLYCLGDVRLAPPLLPS